MKIGIKTKAVVFALLIVCVTTAIATTGAALLNSRQTRRGNLDRLQKALDSVERQLRQTFAELNKTYGNFAHDRQNNYFLRSSISMGYFLWQDNFSLLGLPDQLQLDRLAFYYVDPASTADGDRLRMFYERGGAFVQIEPTGKQLSVTINEFGAPDAVPLQTPVTPAFPEQYAPAPPLALRKKQEGLRVEAHFELRHATEEGGQGEHLGYFLLEQPLMMDIPLINRELGVYVTIYDVDGRAHNTEISLPDMTPTAQAFSTTNIMELLDARGQRYDALAQAMSYNGERVGYLSVSISQADTIRKSRETMLLLSLLGVAMLFPLALMVEVLVARLIRPILSLTKVASEIAQGNLDLPVAGHDRDELGVLAGSFAHMRDEIQRRIRELQQLNAELDQRVAERTAELARQNYILDTFMLNVPDSIYFKDRDSRFIHSNMALARAIGLREPAEMLGKTDFDFFPESLARMAYDDEQRILKTGQPMLSKEEADPRGNWILTSKMPLRDDRGEIIGTFGISRDITPLKVAQQQVEEAYAEIQMLNEQLQQENLRMGAELDIARRIQQMVLPMPAELRSIPGLDIVGYMQPAAEVGGDYYDVLRYPDNRLCIGIGDVTGHGLESGLLMLMTQTAIRTLIDRGETDPVVFLDTLNRVLYQNIQRMGVERSLTLALVNYQAGQLRVIGQHEEALIARQDGRVERLDTINLGFPLGMVHDIRSWIGEATVTLGPGDGVVLYTDGITEAQNTANELYGLERLCAVISAEWPHATAEAVKEAVVADVRRFIGGAHVHDDVTFVVMKQL